MNQSDKSSLAENKPLPIKCWVNWRYEEREGSRVKVLYQPSGAPASEIDPASWSSLDDVLDTTGYDGIGIILDGEFKNANLFLLNDGIYTPQNDIIPLIKKRLKADNFSTIIVRPSSVSYTVVLRGTLEYICELLSVVAVAFQKKNVSASRDITKRRGCVIQKMTNY